MSQQKTILLTGAASFIGAHTSKAPLGFEPKTSIKKTPKNLLSPQRAAKYFPQIFLPLATGVFSLSKSFAARRQVLNPDLKIKQEIKNFIGEYTGGYKWKK